MAFSNGFGERKNEEFPFRAPQSPPNESSFGDYPANIRSGANRMAPGSQTDERRASLQRRFTTESGRVPTMAPIGQQVAEPIDRNSTEHHKLQLVEQKRLECEMLREHRRRFAAEMQLLDLRQHSNEQELLQMKQDLNRANAIMGPQSEPTTPPEYRDSGAGFPSVLSRPNRYSSSSLASPPGLNHRISNASSQITSPPSHRISAPVIGTKMPSKSVPGSRRNSDENEPEAIFDQDPIGSRPSAALNRNSMPATSANYRSRNEMSNYSSAAGLGQINTTGFLFGDDESHSKKENSTTSPDVKTYLQMNATDDKFPILVRRNDYPGLLSASSAALDLALSQSPGPESQPSGWPSFARHRPAQHSLPMNTLPTDADLRTDASKHPKAGPTAQLDEGAGSSRNFDRRSLDLSFGPLTEATKTSASPASGSVPGAQVTPPKLGASYSTNDIPTMKNAAGLGGVVPTANSHAQKHFHNHNASLGRIPPNAVNNRLSRDLSNSDVVATGRESQGIGFQPFQSALQASAPPFGPPLHAAASVGHNPAVPNAPTMSPYGLNGYFNGFGMPMMNMNGPQMNNQMYPPQGSYQPYPVYGYGSRGSDSQARVIQQRRMADGEANRFANVQLESLRGEIYPLCKDQHGCRYLQKKLEERTPEHIQIIFLETNQHVVELMTDPFGNYLCQKLLEYANDEQRTVLINNAAPQLVKIALNQHGTRALQKMIEFISTPEQIQTIIYALQDRVVELIQDLNGNHVIQKCLNRLTPEDAQFIFDAVGYSCVTVGTHRHGCCVLQRCIDHASGTQKAQLISQISQNALALVQDPFGNYVVQYILDLGEPSYTEPLVQRFLKQVPALSKQKFSSNVIEKCLRTAEHPMKSLMIEEMLPPVELEKMLRDSYANYVIQTAIDFATPDLQARLVDTIRPMLPTIRSTPFGRRIQGKVQTFDSRSGSSSGQRTPSDVTSPGQISLVGQGHSPFHPRPGSNQGQSALNLNNAFANLNFGQGTRSPAASGIGTPPVVGPSAYGNRLAGAAAPEQYQDGRQNPSGQQQFAGNYGRVNAPGNGYYF